MALQQTVSAFGTDYNGYIKIMDYEVFEQGQDDNGKIYKSKLHINYYTNNTKNYCIKGENIILEDLRLNDLTLQNYYVKLLAMEQFSNALSV